MTKTFGKLLKEIREEMGYSKRKMGRYLNVSPVNIVSWEYERKTPSFYTAVRIAEILDIDLNMFKGKKMN
jgi:DNA-binding XRE family transcriptional regulator